MKLHTHPEEFRELITVVANEKHISESAVERDYYIVMMLKSLADSPYADQCVFKGGTSLSKCYPGSIDRFSEDIDLTFLGMELSDKACDKAIKKIETIMAAGAQTEKIVEERSNRSKSMYETADWFARRFDEDGTVYKAQIDKEHIFALFNGRDESEVVLDPKYLKDITQAQEPTQGQELSM